MSVNKKAFKLVCEQLAEGPGHKDLTLDMVGSVFGQDFWIIMVMCLMDAQDASRAIQGAINRLRQGEEEERLVN